MNHAIYSPFDTLNGLHRLSRVIDDGFARSDAGASNWSPQVDIREFDDNFTVQVDLPGVDPKDVDITVDKDVLTVKGSRLTEHESKGYRRLERFSGPFSRQFTLPEAADGEHITAKSNHGVLEITIPKTEKTKPLTIVVNS